MNGVPCPSLLQPVVARARARDCGSIERGQTRILCLAKYRSMAVPHRKRSIGVGRDAAITISDIEADASQKGRAVGAFETGAAPAVSKRGSWDLKSGFCRGERSVARVFATETPLAGSI